MKDMNDIMEIPQKCPRCHRYTRLNWLDITYELIPESFVIIPKGFMGCPNIFDMNILWPVVGMGEHNFDKVMEDKVMQVTAMTGGKVYFCKKCGFYAGYGGNKDAISFVDK